MVISDVSLAHLYQHAHVCHFFLFQLAPSLPLQEDFVYHWKAITHYYIETSGKRSLKEQVNTVVMMSPETDGLLCGLLSSLVFLMMKFEYSSNKPGLLMFVFISPVDTYYCQLSILKEKCTYNLPHPDELP